MGICKKAERISLEVSAVLELLYDKGKDEMKHFHNSSYSVEDMAVSEAFIKFSCQKVNGTYESFDCDSFSLHCKCCEQNVFNDVTSLNMNQILKITPDAMFCHLFKSILPTKDIPDYLFNNKLRYCDELPKGYMLG